MYYRESDSIANSQYDLAAEIQRLDELMFESQGEPIRLATIVGYLDVDDEKAESLLALYEEAKVLTRRSLDICPDCDEVIEAVGSICECDLCGKRFGKNDVEQDVGFVPRRTMFESGDVLKKSQHSRGDVDGIYRIVGCSSDDRIMDVVFVHGLDGDATETWHPQGNPQAYWPKWLGEDLPQVGIWSIEYEAKSLKWKGDALPLSDRATSCIEKLLAAGIGERPLVFIAHSLGGLLVKQILRHAKELGNPDWFPIWQNCQGVIFLATPHSGSSMSNYVQYLKLVLAPTIAVGELEAHHPRLRELNVWYRNNTLDAGVKTKAFFETQTTLKIQIVDATTADPGIPGIVPIPVETDHIQICKMKSRGDAVYVGCKHFIQKAIRGIA